MEEGKKDIIEEIGKVKLNLAHYPGEDYYCDGEIEDELLDIAKKYSEVEYQHIIEERKSWPILYHLSPLRENIVEWLPIDKSMKVLEVGSGCGAITGVLARKAGEVTCIDLSKKRSMINAYRHMDCNNVTIHVGNFQDIEPELPCDYDYVCLIGVFEYGQAYIDSEHPYEDFLRIVSKHRKSGGSIVIAIENKFGLKYWAGCKEDHLGTWFSGLEDYPEGGNVRTFTRDGLIKIAESCGFSDISMYYPYPDYKFMTSLYSDERLPKAGELSSNLRNFDRERLQLFDEKMVFDTIIKEEQFPLFSNSYMMILGQEPEIKYAKYSNDRALDYKIKTLVTHYNLNGSIVKQIEKHALSNEAREHIMQMQQAYEALSERFAGGKLLINKCNLVKTACDSQDNDNDSVYAAFEYLEGRTLEEILDECLDRNEIEKFHMLFDKYFEYISYNDEIPVTDYDLVFSNILVSPDEQWHVIDYEWTFAKQLEAKELAFRAVYCYLLENAKRNKLDLDSIMSRLEITEADAGQYRMQEKEFQKYVTGRRRSMIEIRDLIGQPVYPLAEIVGELPDERRKGRIQIYEDTGEGFSEQNSFFLDQFFARELSSEDFFLEDSSSKEKEFRITIGEGRKAIRLDPCSDYCIVFFKEIKWNGVEISSKSKCISENGFQIGDDTYAFATEDPNITLQLSELAQRGENTLEISMQVSRIPKETVEHLQKKESRHLIMRRKN